MTIENYVAKEVCSQVHKNIEKQLETGERRMNAHGADITDLKVIMAQLVQLQQTNTAQLTAMEKRVQELEINHHEQYTDNERSPPKETFLNGPSGLLIIKGTFFLLGIIVLAAIGQNVSPDFVAKLIGK